ALAQIERGEIQAYLGADPHPSDALPDSVGAVEALGSFVVIEVNPDSPLVRGPEGECTVAAAVIGDLAKHGSAFVFHPYPVTPFHGDYLYHADLSAAARRRWNEAAGHAP